MKQKRTSTGIQRIDSFGAPRALGARTAMDPSRRPAVVRTIASMTPEQREAMLKLYSKKSLVKS